jgi:hypothetical protein
MGAGSYLANSGGFDIAEFVRRPQFDAVRSHFRACRISKAIRACSASTRSAVTPRGAAHSTISLDCLVRRAVFRRARYVAVCWAGGPIMIHQPTCPGHGRLADALNSVSVTILYQTDPDLSMTICDFRIMWPPP